MFGMNAQDAQGFMEDVAVIDSAHRAADSQRRTAMNETMAGVANFIGIKERDNRITDLQQDRNKEVIHATALQKTLEHVIRDFAKSAGVSGDKLMERYNIVRTQHFNALANEGMAKEWFDKDPRLNMNKAKNWYIPGLDSDHGF